MLTLWELILGRTVHLEVLEDNEATIKVVRKGYSPKLRSIARTQRVDLGSIKEILVADTATLKYVNTKEQAADVFTKALAPAGWPNAMRLMGLLSPPELCALGL